MTTKRIFQLLIIVLLVLIAAAAAVDIYIQTTREPACDPATSYTGFCVNFEKDYAGATATVAALTEEAK